jgi:hypothetical protein
MGSRITIRTGTSTASSDRPLTINVSKDRKGEHFTLTIHPLLDESKTVIQVLDTDKKLRQMLLNVVYWTIPEKPNKDNTRKYWTHPNYSSRADSPISRKVVEKLLVGHDEMHWFVAGVSGSKTIREAFARLKPSAVTVASRRSGVKNKNWFKRNTKGFLSQGEWFFVPVHFEENKLTVIHKNEPISRPGGTPHIVEELVRQGGETVYSGPNQQIITAKEYAEKVAKDPTQASFWRQRSRGARVLGRGKVKHPDHHTKILNGWHEIHLSNEFVGMRGTNSVNAFID